VVGPLQVIGSQQGADAATLLAPARQVWKIEDFLAKWTKQGAARDTPDNGAIATILLAEIDTYRCCLPYLKTCCRGNGWEDSHWSQLFSLLGLPSTGARALSKESLTLAHFLDRADQLVASADKITALDAQVSCCAASRLDQAVPASSSVMPWLCRTVCCSMRCAPA
jgi:hypothetical protein